MKTKLLLFDFDGTIFDTAPAIHRAVNIVARERGVEEFSFEMVQQVIGFGLEALVKRLDGESKHKLGQLSELREQFIKVYSEIALEVPRFFPGCIDFLKSWEGQLAIVSNKTEKVLHHIVANSDLAGIPWVCVLGGDSLEAKKPDPLPLLKAMERARRTAEYTILVGDGVPDALACQAAQVPFIGVRFGYAPETELIQNGCRFFIDGYSDLHEQIQLVDASRNGSGQS